MSFICDSREDARWKNDCALITAMNKYNFQLPRGNWRATQEVDGVIPSLPGKSLRCIATDGISGTFWCDSEKKIYRANIKYFQWQNPEKILLKYYSEEEKKDKVALIQRKDGAPGPMYRFKKKK